MQSLAANYYVMARKRPRDLQQLFGGQRLQRFTDFTEQYQIWQQQLQQCFAALELSPLLKHCKVVSVRAHTLLLEVSSAAIGNRIKQQQSGIITHFGSDSTLPITQVDVRVKPTEQYPSLPIATAPVKTPQKAVSNDDETIAKLRQQAELCEEPLRSQLLALAAKYESSSNS